MKKSFSKIITIITIFVFLAQAGFAENKYKVELVSFGDKKINVINAVRSVVTGMGLKEAKDMVEGVPSTVKKDLTKEQAAVIFVALEEAGANVKIEAMPGSEYEEKEIEALISEEKAADEKIAKGEEQQEELGKEEAPVEEKVVKKKKAAKKKSVKKKATKKKATKKKSKKGKTASMKGKEFKIKEIKFFEAEKGMMGGLGMSPPFLSHRTYGEEFPKTRTRYVYVEVDVLYEIRDGEWEDATYFDHEVLLYGPDGQLWDDSSTKLTAGRHSMFGWDSAGSWPPGEYRAKITIKGKKVGEKTFKIIDDKGPMDSDAHERTGIEFYKVRFFEGGDPAPKEDERKYEETFPRSKARRIYAEIRFRNLDHGKKDKKHTVKVVWYKQDKTVMGEQELELDLKKGQSVGVKLAGWGWDEPGEWWTGRYKVEILISEFNKKEKKFRVYNDLVKGKASMVKFDKMEFFEAGPGAADPKSYTTVFNAATAKFIYVKPTFRNLMYHDKTGYYDITIIYKNSKGNKIGQMQHKMNVKPEWKTCSFFKGWGKKEPGYWKPGEHEVKVSGNNAGAGSEKFVVK
ncbi:ribosomal protein bL12 [Candidatus Omnitrophota bacterium]